MEDINQNFTSNMSGVDFNMDLQSQNTSDYSIDDAHEANNIRRNYNGYREQ